MRTQDLTSELPCHGGVRKVYIFPNRRGASVIRHSFSYGGDDGLWELGVLNGEGDLDYSTPITDDVLGYLTEERVDEILEQIAQLPEEDR